MVGLVQSGEGLNRTKGRARESSFLRPTVFELVHPSPPAFRGRFRWDNKDEELLSDIGFVGFLKEKK